MSYPDYQVEIRIFGSVQLSNSAGFVKEPKEPSLSWLILKYLLVSADRKVSQDEIMEQLWPNAEERKSDGAMRTRLSRLRSALVPLRLGGQNGLVLYSDGFYSLNPECEIDMDLNLWRMLTERVRVLPVDDPKGLLYCKNALKLYQGEILENTKDAAWLTALRLRCHKELRELCRSTLERMKEIDDYSILPLLGERAADFLPEDKDLHKEILVWMVEQEMWEDLAWYRKLLNRHGPIDWLEVREGETPAVYGDLDVGVRLFGTFEIENKWGRIIEKHDAPVVWLPLKYFLSQKAPLIEEEELRETLWPGEEQNFDKYRRRKMRDTLIPLRLDGIHNGLFLFFSSLYGLNLNYTVLRDTEAVDEIYECLGSVPADDPDGLRLCMDALTLYRGRFLAHTSDAAWFADMREHYDRLFIDLIRETVQRTRATGDDRALPLLLNRIVAVMP